MAERGLLCLQLRKRKYASLPALAPIEPVHGCAKVNQGQAGSCGSYCGGDEDEQDHGRAGYAPQETQNDSKGAAPMLRMHLRNTLFLDTKDNEELFVS